MAFCHMTCSFLVQNLGLLSVISIFPGALYIPLIDRVLDCGMDGVLYMDRAMLHSEMHSIYELMKKHFVYNTSVFILELRESEQADLFATTFLISDVVSLIM